MALNIPSSNKKIKNLLFSLLHSLGRRLNDQFNAFVELWMVFVSDPARVQVESHDFLVELVWIITKYCISFLSYIKQQQQQLMYLIDIDL